MSSSIFSWSKWVGTSLYRLFIVLQLALAIYFSHRAIKLWHESPVVVSVDAETISKIQFPAVTVCHPITWTWPSIGELLNHLDTDQKIISKYVSRDVEVLDSHFKFFGGRRTQDKLKGNVQLPFMTMLYTRWRCSHTDLSGNTE